MYNYNNWQIACTFHIWEVFLCVLPIGTLPIGGIRHNESGIVNLDNDEGLVTHWVRRTQRVGRVVLFILMVLAIFDHRENWCDMEETTHIEYNCMSYQC